MKNWMQNLLKVIQDIYAVLSILNSLYEKLKVMDAHLKTIVEVMKALSQAESIDNETNAISPFFKPELSLLDIKDVIKILNISTTTYYRLVKQGELMPRRKGRRHYYYKEDLSQQLEEGKRRGRI